MTNSPLVTFDEALAIALHAGATSSSSAFFEAVTLLGQQGLTVLTVGLAILLLFRRKWRDALLVLAVRISENLLNRFLKSIFLRPRPFFPDPIITAEYYSFPSGHAMGAMVMYSLVVYLLFRLNPRRPVRIAAITLAALLILLIGFSRLALGVHYFSDVLAGYAAGGAWLVVCIWIRERVGNSR